jgi:hypothetical protein
MPTVLLVVAGLAVLGFVVVSVCMTHWSKHAEYSPPSRRDYMDQLDALIAADRRARQRRPE